MTQRDGMLGRSPRLARILVVVVLLGGHALAFRSAALAGRDMLTGDGSFAGLRPGARYEVLRVPPTPAAIRYEADNRIASDFAQIYFPVRNPGAGDAYSEATPDPWGRESRYAPFVHWACEVSICSLPYGPASLAHMAIQYGVFLGSFIYAFLTLGTARHLPAALLVVNVGLFLTPVGLSWFERGQFSVYVAAAYLWLLLGIHRSNGVFLAVAALLAYVKWTSFPMLFVVIAVWVLAAADRHVLWQRVRLAGIPVATVAGLFLLFPVEGLAFLQGVAGQESGLEPHGLSLARVLPRWVVKALPFALVALGALRLRQKPDGSSADPVPADDRWLPFVLGTGVLLLLYPTWAYDYSVPCLFGLIPFAIQWADRSSPDRRSFAWTIATLFVLFLLGASSVKIVDAFAAADTDLAMIGVYVAVAATLLGVSLAQAPSRAA